MIQNKVKNMFNQKTFLIHGQLIITLLIKNCLIKTQLIIINTIDRNIIE